MASVSQATVRNQLKGSGSVNLKNLHLNGYTRTLAGSGYAAMNPFQVQAGFAPDPATYGAPFYQNDWEFYSHGSFASYRGDDLAKTGGYNSVHLTWTRPPGYTRATGLLRQLLYYKLMGTTEDLNVNPFVDPIMIIDVGDVTSYTLSPLSEGRYYAIGLLQEFNDTDGTYLPSPENAYAHSTGETPLLSGVAGISSGPIFAPEPTINGISQTPSNPLHCSFGDFITINVNVTMQGTSTGRLEQSVNGGGFTLVNSNIAAGTTGNIPLTRQSGNNYQFRLRYNAISPDDWAVSSTWYLDCGMI